MSEQWIAWARRLQAIAQSGLAFTPSAFDQERYEQIRRIAAEMMAAGDDAEVTRIESLFAEQSGYTTPKVDVRGVVFRDERVLMVRETLDGGRWTLPGGWADVNDSPSEAVEREIREEAGYRTRATKLLALYDRNRHGHPPYAFHAYKMFFRCELLDDAQDLQANVETSEAGWFSEAEIAGLELSIGRVTAAQLSRFYEHLRHPEWPTDFD
jgi:ADP-ribose pyrophosphatase YjhB (NUDIX family)